MYYLNSPFSCIIIAAILFLVTKTFVPRVEPNYCGNVNNRLYSQAKLLLQQGGSWDCVFNTRRGDTRPATRRTLVINTYYS